MAKGKDPSVSERRAHSNSAATEFSRASDLAEMLAALISKGPLNICGIPPSGKLAVNSCNLALRNCAVRKGCGFKAGVEVGKLLR